MPLPDRNVTHILVSRAKDRVWLGTSGGVASYDGVTAKAPQFDDSRLQQSLIVNSLVEIDHGTVIVGTINDSLWRWTENKISPVYGACDRNAGGCPRADWALARSEDGNLYVVSSSFAPRQTEAISALEEVVRGKVVPVEVQAGFLGFAGEDLVAVDNGRIYLIDRASGKVSSTINFQVEPGTFVRNVSYAAGKVLIGTDKNCLSVGLRIASTPELLATGNCSAVYQQRDGTAWVSTDYLYRHQNAWMRWSPGQSSPIKASSIIEDGLANVWIGSPLGLWRYFDVSREQKFVGDERTISSMVPGPDGGIVVGLKNGEAWRLTRQLEASRLELPAAGSTASPYFPGALLASGSKDRLWALTGAGLFSISDAKTERVADYPVPKTESSVAPSTLAVSDDGTVCVGLFWSISALCVSDKKWREVAEVDPDFGGSAIGALAFDQSGTMFAVGVVGITVASGERAKLGPFSPAPYGKKHLFGAIALTDMIEGADAVASGGWGGTVFLKRNEGKFAVVGFGGPDVQDQPYIIRSFAAHRELGLLAATDAGLFRWEGSVQEGRWKTLRGLDPRLAEPINLVVPSTGRGFWVASAGSVALIHLPSAKPEILIERTPSTETIDTNSVTYRLVSPGLVGMPSSKITVVSYNPPIANAERRLVGPENRLDLSNLDDLKSYRLFASVTDGFLNVGDFHDSRFSVSLPFYRNPYKLTAAILASILCAGLLLTRRGPTGFLLRRIGRLKWSLEKGDPRFAVEITALSPDLVRYQLEAPSSLTPIRLEVDVPSALLNGMPKQMLPYLVQTAEAPEFSKADFEGSIARVSKMLGEDALPDNMRFTTSQFHDDVLSLSLSKSLIWLPIELADDGTGEMMQLRYAIGRTVTADVTVRANPLSSSRLKVAVFGPKQDRSGALPHVAAEIDSVSKAVKSWGADVIWVRPDATKAEVLNAICDAHLFHYAGHAQFVPGAPDKSYLPIYHDQILAEEVAAALKLRPHNLVLAFINGCGSCREAPWQRSAEIYGFASAFMANSAYFVGAQWPIDDEFAAAFAREFYSRLFPAAYDMWWRLVRRDPLSGIPFAEALRLARHHLLDFGPVATQTWSSYVYYGDPTRRLVLR
ncbi:ligand-binding sensor domain-containing protein [Bradyrhizobium sp. AZCC 1610]